MLYRELSAPEGAHIQVRIPKSTVEEMIEIEEVS
jgi:hypothetical protein